MNKFPISVFIITKDEEDRLPTAILSVKDWVDEIIVVDSGSNDNTVKLAESMGAITYYRKWEGYGPQKVWAESQCKNNFLLNIDADEEISEKLRDEIIDLFITGEPELYAYKLRIVDMRRFAKEPSIFSAQHNRLRFYHKGKAGFKDSLVHDSVIALEDGIKIGQLDGIVYHRTFRSYSHAVEKMNSYTSMLAEDMFEKGRKVGSIRLITEPFTAFLKGYFFKKHFLLGIDGIFEALLFSFGRTLRLVKLRELWQEESINKK